jgi:sialate O-acetylesterase
MIQPLIPFGIRGAIWYQGESNAGDPVLYRTLLPTMIADWRRRFGVGDFPFFVVQLANFRATTDEPVQEGWAALREAQLITAENDPKVGLAVIIDIGEAKDIHPKNKQDVGLRLGLSARAIAYGQKIPYSGPTLRAMTVEGSAIRLTFDHTDGGLVAKGGGDLKGFAIAGKDQQWHHATAIIDGDTIMVLSDDVPRPAHVRYAWANNPVCNLYNGSGLPASPFRTDRED